MNKFSVNITTQFPPLASSSSFTRAVLTLRIRGSVVWTYKIWTNDDVHPDGTNDYDDDDDVYSLYEAKAQSVERK